MEPIFRQDDPDDELVECVVPECESLMPLAGPDGFVRHMLARHPEDVVTRAIFARLVEVQLLNAETAAEVVR